MGASSATLPVRVELWVRWDPLLDRSPMAVALDGRGRVLLAGLALQAPVADE
jgi:hypothetical protein